MGIDSIFGEKDTSGGLLMLIISLTIIILATVAHEHPKIWFSDTVNVYDILQDIKNIPQENFTAYQEGIFSFSDNSFTIQLEKENKTIKW